MTATIFWPDEMTCIPSDEDLEAERLYWDDMAPIADCDAWSELQAQLGSLETWPLDDLLDELETVRVLTPDQGDVIAELEDEIARRQAA